MWRQRKRVRHLSGNLPLSAVRVQKPAGGVNQFPGDRFSAASGVVHDRKLSASVSDWSAPCRTVSPQWLYTRAS